MSRKQNIDSSKTFGTLVSSIVQVHRQLVDQAVKAVNACLTLRNWMIGCYIREYELGGSDRAEYGERLIAALAEKLSDQGISNCNRRQLYRYRDFYVLYPGIVGTASPQLHQLLLDRHLAKVALLKPFPQSELSSGDLISRLAYSHFEELIKIDDALKRSFYETECLRGNWSVRELKRQIGSLYFERLGLSRKKKKLMEMVRRNASPIEPMQIVQDPYIFEFLGLRSKEVMGESILENTLVDKLQEFLLELGRGFCFEARQKRILIGEEHFFVDLVFYHRILKCHVLIELKVNDFKHEHLGQLNTYVNWYRKHEMTKGDNPPVGILLCTRKNHALVEYALAGMDNRLFVSKYQVELPKKDEIRRFLEEQSCASRGRKQ